MRRLIGLALFLSLPGCRPPALDPTTELLADAPIAEKKWSGILVEFGSPSARPLLGEGWSHGETAPDGNAYRWAIEKSSSFTFVSEVAGPATAWVECEPYAIPDSPEPIGRGGSREPGATGVGSPSRQGDDAPRHEPNSPEPIGRGGGAPRHEPNGPAQVVRFRVNGEPLPPLELRQSRGRYPLSVKLVAGRNDVDMTFTATAQASTGDRRRLAAAFYRFEVPHNPEAVSTFGAFSLVKSREGRAGVWLPAESSISYYTRLPERARLVVTAGAREPRLLAPSGAALEVRVRSLGGEAAEIAAAKRASAPRGEVLLVPLDLGSLSGTDAAVEVRATGADLFVTPQLYGATPKAIGTKAAERKALVSGILVIVLDGASALRVSAETAPHLTELRRESIDFETAVSQAVYTIASVGSLLTGQYPERHQSVSFADRLPASAVTLPGLLTLDGVRTAGFAGNKVVSSVFGLDRGYEEFYEAWKAPGYKGHGDTLTELVSSWLEKNRDGRFFGYVHYREPHFPYVPPAPFDTRFSSKALFPTGISDWMTIEALNRAAAGGELPAPDVVSRIAGLYDGNLAFADVQVGVLLETLKALGLDDKTAVIVTADHGEALSEHGYIGHNTQLYEESVRVPLLMRVPGFAPREVRSVVELIDLAPTLLELAGVKETPALANMAGRSLVPLLAGETLPAAPAFTRTLWDKPRYSVRDESYKLIWDSRTGSVELYDLKRDPREQRSVAGEELLRTPFYLQSIYRWLREQEHLRAGAAAPETTAITDDLGQYLGTVGYLQHLKKKKTPHD